MEKNQLPGKFLKPGTINGQIVRAMNSPKIREIENPVPELKKLMIYLSVVSGIKPENLPDKMGVEILIQWITNNLGQWTIDEMRTAFDLNAAKKLPEHVNHYQILSAPYIGDIMAAYSEMKKTVMIEKNKQIEPNPVVTDPAKAKTDFHDFIRECLIKPWNYFKKTGTLTFGILPSAIIYRTLADRMGLLNIPLDEKREIHKNAVEWAKNYVKKETYDKTEFRKLQYLRDQIQLNGLENALQREIKERCYQVSIERYFDAINAKNEDFAQIAENWIENDKTKP